MHRILQAAAACAVLGLVGCYGEAYPGDDVYLTGADVDTYPYVMYEGRPTYWYNDHWYYREGRHWRYYRHEPRGLYEHRRHWHH